jgi:hypothetical protein
MILASEIREHMHVHSSDGHHVGRVDHVKGDEIELAKMDLTAMGKHHYIPISWVSSIKDDQLILSITKEEATARWESKH